MQWRAGCCAKTLTLTLSTSVCADDAGPENVLLMDDQTFEVLDRLTLDATEVRHPGFRESKHWDGLPGFAHHGVMVRRVMRPGSTGLGMAHAQVTAGCVHVHGYLPFRRSSGRRVLTCCTGDMACGCWDPCTEAEQA